MIGADSRFQGQGYGGDLLIDCLRRLAVAADALGIVDLPQATGLTTNRSTAA